MRSNTLAALLSFTGGFVDTTGFLGLQGLFTAHVTGNFVTLGATLVSAPMVRSPSCSRCRSSCWSLPS
jgi:uncharacterized membrane protein YoaK (UPF0700 family)